MLTKTTNVTLLPFLFPYIQTRISGVYSLPLHMGPPLWALEKHCLSPEEKAPSYSGPVGAATFLLLTQRHPVFVA